MRVSLTAWRALDPADRVLLLRAWALQSATEMGLRLFGYRRIERLLERPPAAGSPEGADKLDAAVERTRRLCEKAARHAPFEVRCLARSLALRRLLAGQGISSSLRIGVRKQGSELDAHAWLELEGRPIGQDPGIDERFAPLDAPRSRGGR